MKILIIVGSFKTGGAERMSINTGEELLRRGYDVHFIVQRPIFEIPNSIPNERITVLRKEQKYDLYYKISSLFLGVFKAANKIDPDVIIAFSRFSSFLACFTFRKNIIARFDANPFRLSKKQRVWADIVLNNPFVRKVVVPSSGMLAELQKVRPNKSDKLFVVPNSINQKNIVINKANQDEFGFKYISAMGRLTIDKNFELLINGYSKSEIHNKYKLIIVGDGKLKQSLVNLVNELQLEDKVIFAGRLENPFPTIANSEFFVNTSINESFCNVILEALTLSKPVIATDCNYGPSDMILNGENGFLIQSGNLNELIIRLNELGGSDDLIRSLSIKAKKSSEKFHIEQVGNMWESLVTKSDS